MNIDIQILIKAAKSGGEVLKKYFGQVLATETKIDSSDYRTRADTESEAAILPIIEAAWPEANINSEERGLIDKGSDYTIVIDPLDGTNNFVLGVPQFSVCIGVVRKKQIVAGVIYNPILDLTYHAVSGAGAFVNDERLRVSAEEDFTRATVSYIQSYETHTTFETKAFSALYEALAKRVTIFWSVGLDFCLLASGRIEAIINNRCQIYDFAAAKLIAREAGAVITDFSGHEEADETNPVFIAANNAVIHKKVLEIVKSISA